LQLGSTAVGIKTNTGVILAAERRLPSKLMIASSLEKVMQVGIIE
jgi:20S proteasome subunit alpha 5